MRGTIRAGTVRNPARTSMPQTLLALLALAVAGLLSFNVKDVSRGTYERQVEDEFEMVAAAVGQQVMETAEERAFDQRSTPAGIYAASSFLPARNGAEFTSWTTFGGTTCDLDALWTTPACDDLDDLSGVTRQIVPFKLRSRWTGTTEVTRELPLDVSIDVEYVLDEDFEVESALPTLHKRVRIYVYLDEGVSTRRSRAVPLATLERVVSYDERKAARDFQRVYTVLPAGYNGPTD